MLLIGHVQLDTDYQITAWQRIVCTHCVTRETQIQAPGGSEVYLRAETLPAHEVRAITQAEGDSAGGIANRRAVCNVWKTVRESNASQSKRGHDIGKLLGMPRIPMWNLSSALV